MKKLLNLFFLVAFSMLTLSSCNVERHDVVDADILQSLPDSVRQDALYRMISSVEQYNKQYFEFWEPFVRSSDELIMAIGLSIIFSISVLLIIYMVLKSRARNLRVELEITQKLLDRIERLQEMNINVSDIKSLIPYTFRKNKTSNYMLDATILGTGIALLVFATRYAEQFFGMLGLSLTCIGALRCIVHLISYYNKKQ